MSPNLAIVSEGKKFMWDGQAYQTREEAVRAAESYRNDSFETQMVEDAGNFLVYTRRVVREISVRAE